ncbi:trehalose-6-phosphate synthase [Chitinophagaceae bacterium LB-8]|uniref:Trehalose-6-phosphate synthase n=1 Tax=Paraflavisolibacter caeni TaxID=2982496 RepID=A0A9X3BFP3_9BACT|nr:trehalose-6-phosphate synthase [Paraflavisolibacter caeni]MCU7549309.1 trehalose-6-phosphate synthase [Paraflavisolibacter caeni]
MKVNVALIVSIIVAVGLVAFGFTAFQISTERGELMDELKTKTIRLADEFYENHLTNIEKGDSLHITDSIISQYNFTGVLIYYNADSIVPLNSEAKAYIEPSADFIAQTLSADSSMGNLITVAGKNIYQFTRVIKREEMPESAVVFYADASYIRNIINRIWLRSFVRWFLQALLISVITLLIVRRGILMPLNKLIDWVKAARSGDMEKLRKRPPNDFLQPLYQEITGIAKAMQEAKAIAQEEARLRTSAESVWTPERLNEEMKHILNGKKLVVVSNREPYMHIRAGKDIQCIMPASGMVTALEPILKACGGLWVASGSGDADREMVDENDKVLVPPYENKYTLRRIWLTKEQEDHFYYGFSNEGLWPLCHIAHTRPVFRKIDFDYYAEVNQLYADSVVEEIKNEQEAFILVQDYHFALLPRLIKEKRPDAKVAIFWHIPWPNSESFGICPWQKELLLGMLGADLIGFHTQYHCNNFLETVNNTLESRVIWENFSVKIGNHFTLVKPFPISIAFTLKDYETSNEPKREPVEILRQYGLRTEAFGIGVDRIDYTKGLLEKFQAIERFFDKYPSYIGRFTFVQIGAPSRTLIKSYADIVSAVENEANRINWKLKTKNWQPILFLKKHHSHEEIIPFYQSANFCMVTSLHDGMNLVAKEYIAARDHNDGVLILSQFAGASNGLYGALIINPYDIEQSADAIKAALEMPGDEQQHKMKHMRRMVMSHNVYAWAASILKSMASIEN